MIAYIVVLVLVFVAAFIVSVVLNNRKNDQQKPQQAVAKKSEKKVGGQRGQVYMDSIGIKVWFVWISVVLCWFLDFSLCLSISPWRSISLRRKSQNTINQLIFGSSSMAKFMTSLRFVSREFVCLLSTFLKNKFSMLNIILVVKRRFRDTLARIIRRRFMANNIR